MWSAFVVWVCGLRLWLCLPLVECTEEDGTCDEIAAELPFKSFVGTSEEEKYKYILDVDGNAWSARFKRLLTSGSMILKSTIHPEFWNDRIQPWYHCACFSVPFCLLSE